MPGFVLCSPYNLCHTGRVFDAQVCSCSDFHPCTIHMYCNITCTSLCLFRLGCDPGVQVNHMCWI